MSDDPRLPYVVRGENRNGIRKYLCPTPQRALRKLRDFEKSGYAKIAAMGPHGPVTEAELVRLVEAANAPIGGGPADVDAPNAPELVA